MGVVVVWIANPRQLGDIAIQTIDFPPGSEFELGVNSFNMAMGMVGIKNAAVALKNFAVKLPETTRRLLRNNESLRAALLAELRKIKDLDASELTPQQKLAWEKVQAAKKKMLNLLESGEEAAKAGSYFGNLPRYQQLFKEGKLSELFAELKNTTAYPRMGYTRNRTYDFLYDEYKIANPNFENCPYLKNSIGTDFELDEVGYFVRLYSGDGKASKWIFRIEDLKKYDNIDDLIEDLAIPFDNGTIFGTKPSKIAIVEIPKGTTLRKSFAGEQVWKRTHDGLSDLIQKGGGVQYEILDVNFKNPPPSVKAWFGEVGEFDELIK